MAERGFMHRRDFLVKAGAGLAATSAALALGADQPGKIAAGPQAAPPSPLAPAPSPLAPPPLSPAACAAASGNPLFSLPLVRAQPDRITTITVCTRPFREQGPRIETEKLGRKTIVHNYGHGGTGWSLSWGSATLALREVLATREREIAVIGCGVIGLTSALVAQRAGLKVRIYTKDRPPEVRSTFATGNWSPASRYCTADAATPEVTARWEEITRISYRAWQFMIGLPGDLVEWRDGYALFNPSRSTKQRGAHEGEPAYPALEARIQDLTPRPEYLAPGTHPFPAEIARRHSNMVFNISACMHMYIAEFLAAGGAIETREFQKPRDIARLREKTVINATGYGARALFGDESIIPVRGQIARLIPQPEVTYSFYWDDIFMLSRRDTLLVQAQAHGDYGNADITPDRAASERAVLALAVLNEQIRANQAC